MRSSRVATASKTNPLRRTRAFVAWVAVGVLLLASVGFLPSAERLARLGLVQRAGERFPCEGCACGCASAEQCWTSCCCHPLEQRLAWAEANGVPIPRSIALIAYRHLQARAREEALPACCRSASGGGGECCAHAATRVLGPVMSALACRGVSGWLVPAVTAPASSSPTGSWTGPADTVTPRVAFLVPASERTPGAHALERDPPPPRA